MVTEVNKLILNTLVEQGAVYIPNLGTLSIYRTASRKRGSKLSAPSYSVTYTAECKATSLSDVIMTIAHIDKASAEDIVERWHKKIDADGRVVIDGVGTITNGYFSPESDLIAKLNTNNETIRLSAKSNGSRRLWLIPLLIAALVALGLNLYLVHINREPAKQDPIIADTSTDTLVVENTNVENEKVSEETTTTDVVAETETTEPAPEQSEASAEVAEATTTPAAEAVEQVPAVEATPVTEEVAPATVEQAPAPRVVEQQTQQSVAQINDWRQLGARHYVIYGSYSNTTNANNAIRKILRRNPAAQCQIIRIGSLHGVAVYGSYYRNDCETFKRKHRSLYKDAWIHTPRR